MNALGEKDVIKRFSLIYALFKDDEVAQLIGQSTEEDKELIHYYYDLLNGKTKYGVEAMMSNDLRMNLSDDLLLYTDKISMHFSIEARVPLLDNDLIDFVESLPYEYRIKGKEGKYIHKKFAERVLPKEIIYRKKKGFQSPTEKWFKGEKGKYYKTLLLGKNSVFAQFFNLKEVENYFDVHMNNDRNLEKQLFTLISIYYWMENNV